MDDHGQEKNNREGKKSKRVVPEALYITKCPWDM
jgi:hypothetical protein